jgi:hypothetical protein
MVATGKICREHAPGVRFVAVATGFHTGDACIAPVQTGDLHEMPRARYTSPADILHRALGGIRATYPASRGMTTSPLDVYHHVERSGARYTSPANHALARQSRPRPPITPSSAKSSHHSSVFSIALRLCVVVLQPPSTNRRATHASPLRKLFHATVTQRILYRYACSDWTNR